MDVLLILFSKFQGLRWLDCTRRVWLVLWETAKRPSKLARSFSTPACDEWMVPWLHALASICCCHLLDSNRHGVVNERLQQVQAWQTWAAGLNLPPSLSLANPLDYVLKASKQALSPYLATFLCPTHSWGRPPSSSYENIQGPAIKIHIWLMKRLNQNIPAHLTQTLPHFSS